MSSATCMQIGTLLLCCITFPFLFPFLFVVASRLVCLSWTCARTLLNLLAISRLEVEVECYLFVVVYFSDVITSPGEVEEPCFFPKSGGQWFLPNTIIFSNFITGFGLLLETDMLYLFVFVCTNCFKSYFFDVSFSTSEFRYQIFFMSKHLQLDLKTMLPTLPRKPCGTRRCRARHVLEHNAIAKCRRAESEAQGRLRCCLPDHCGIVG